jgi:hypothetical protein
MVIVLAVLFLAACWTPDSQETSAPGPGNGFSGWGCPRGKTLHWYVSDGRWKADARTALAMMQYLLAPNLDLWTPPAVPQPAPFLSAATNSGTNMPKV